MSLHNTSSRIFALQVSCILNVGFGLSEIQNRHVTAALFSTGQYISSNYADYNNNKKKIIINSEKATKAMEQCKVQDSPPCYLKKTLSDWQFSPSSVLQYGLPIDPILDNYLRPNVCGAMFSVVKPDPLTKNLKLAAYSKDVLTNILDMDPAISDSTEFVEWIAGKNVLNSSTTLAHRYGGHQFGVWALQLGDGRAISLGEYVSRNGKHWDIQLKGSGLTPYSRGGDGRAVLRSSIREFLCSEAMHALSIPTSRAAALVVSSDVVVRDKFYMGRPEHERAAIVMRIAPSWLRFGSLEILTWNEELEELQKLLNYIISMRQDINTNENDKYYLLLEKIFEESISLVVQWQSVGFTHGVLNTDNMSLWSVTIDYGPFGFMEAYKPNFIPNTSDSDGRYAYSEQIKVLHWNLERLGAAVWPVLSESERKKMQHKLDCVLTDARTQLGIKFDEKLGFRSSSTPKTSLHNLLLKMMEETGSDFTMTFRQLGYVSFDDLSNPAVCEKHWCLRKLVKHDSFKDFLNMYGQHMQDEGLSDDERQSTMLAANPQYVLRNWMAQQAIESAENDDFDDVHFILHILNNPFTVNEQAEEMGYSGPPPNWAHSIQVSCSS